jgi:uncharacterized repeat protein (TIGR01451 family)
MIALIPFHEARAACVCGYQDGRFTVNQPMSVDGNMNDWIPILNDIDNVSCDGGDDGHGTISQPQPDRDAPVQSTGRDLIQFAYTWDANYVYAFTERAASTANVQNFIYYADANNNGKMESGEPVVVVKWSGSNRSVDVFIGAYQTAAPGGDSMVDDNGYGDGYHLPGKVVNLPANGQPTYSGTWGSVDGVKMEWAVPWAVLGIPPNTAFTFHVSSTNSTPGTGSFPDQIDDNMGGCGGKGATTQYAGLTFTPNHAYQFPTSTKTINLPHIITNSGNGGDSFALSLATVSGPLPQTVRYYLDDGAGNPTGAAFTTTPAITPGGVLRIVVVLTWNGNPTGPGVYTFTATSAFNPLVSATVTDTLTSQPTIMIAKQTIGGVGSFNFTNGTNGLPASLALTTTALLNPVFSPPYIVTTAGQPAAITETVPAGWSLTSARCVNASGTDIGATLANGTLTVPGAALTGAATLTCTFTNTKLMPNLVILKTAQTVWDPVNLGINPRSIPGAQVLYTLTVTNYGPAAADSDSVIISDPIPGNTSLVVADNPVTCANGTPTSGLTFNCGAYNDFTDNALFSKDGFDWSYSPVVGANNADPLARYLRIVPTGQFSGSSGGANPTFSITFKVIIN